MDPQGMITLEGMIMGRQYYKETLAKIGIGFTEWRYFKYKSAMEAFSEEKMSEADREQRLALVEDFYSLARTDISSGRNLSLTRFDELVNNEVFFIAEDALKAGLVDTLARWDTVLELVKKETGNDNLANPKFLEKFILPSDNYWGRKPEIAVIYAIGACAMDEGINARQLVKDVKRAVENNNIKAIVLRVDSPGGDGLASDIIAEELKKAKGKKPVIVSQGYVAASGGYWLSMYADTIIAAPNTITGSIGVIGGFYYNTELKEKLGISTDFVKKGDHADLGFGFTVPLLGVSLPDRDLTPEEQEKAESLIKRMYNDFVQKVAAGRNMSFDEVNEIAQGRVWSGIDGFDNGLVDGLGGLDDAIKIAAGKAGLYGKEYNIIELPEPGMFDLNIFMPKLFGINYKEDPSFKTLKLRLQHNGQPLPMLPLEDALDWEMKMSQ
jgi:protease IV